jgi:hypothetical protein
MAMINLFLLEVPTFFTRERAGMVYPVRKPGLSPAFKAGMIRERMIAPLRAEFKPIPF